ncbi:hypothetical protein BDV37DRAFT_263365 [Aspergillus pseudonomiae]|uniref:Uncharacterized protein n=1 Tax=Aspergillus pseudonomiae TaxID=1506151 RepID=A0A5N7CXU5_9EURO|nr:uncharacterized protein BDV37DRAFT_263365 [Aspergillus pseudonomiae]KAE8398403.1 hypothetical protein BDV37DRAFT_263365 [Aspergillus pseudonomiae]
MECRKLESETARINFSTGRPNPTKPNGPTLPSPPQSNGCLCLSSPSFLMSIRV